MSDFGSCPYLNARKKKLGTYWEHPQDVFGVKAKNDFVNPVENIQALSPRLLAESQLGGKDTYFHFHESLIKQMFRIFEHFAFI